MPEKAKIEKQKAKIESSDDEEESNDLLGAMRRNPWMVSSIVLGVLLVGALVLGGAGITGKAVSEEEIKESVASFLGARTPGIVVNSVEKESGLYKVMLLYQGQEVPVYVTLDGENLIAEIIPIDSAGDSGSSGIGQRVEVETEGAPVLGDVNARVTIVEFSDYQCPFCRKFYDETYELLKTNYIDTGKAKLVFMDFPLSFHEGAVGYARAARCVRDLGGDEAYFEMHDKIFEEQIVLDGGTVKSTIPYVGDEAVKSWAKQLGYDISECFDSGKYTEEVNADLLYGQGLGVSGTPGFFVNGILLEGAQPYSVFSQIIESELNSEIEGQ